MSTYRFFPTTNGPASAIKYSGNFVCSLNWTVTQGGCWFEGYWWWCCSSGQSTAPVKCALWSLGSTASQGAVVPGSVVTSGPLTAGTWNYIPLPEPLQLSIGDTLTAEVGCNGSFPSTSNSYGTGDPYVDGITNGPLTTWGTGNSSYAPFQLTGGGYGTGGSDPSTYLSTRNDGSQDNFWVDVQISTAPPSGYSGSYRLWPNRAATDPWTGSDAAVNYVIGTEIDLVAPCQLDNIWYFSPSSSAQLATECGVWSIATQQLVASNPSPSWSGVAGSGWVSSVIPGGIVLRPGQYRVAVYNGASSPDSWSAKRLYYWTGSGTSGGNGSPAGVNGIATGPIYAPPTTRAQSCNEYLNGVQNGSQEPGQSVFAVGPPNAFPNLYVNGLYQNYWVDMEVTPVSVTNGGFLMFFGTSSA